MIEKNIQQVGSLMTGKLKNTSRINIGLRDINNNNLEIVRRDTGEKMSIERKDCINSLHLYLDSNSKNPYSKRLRLYKIIIL